MPKPVRPKVSSHRWLSVHPNASWKVVCKRSSRMPSGTSIVRLTAGVTSSILIVKRTTKALLKQLAPGSGRSEEHTSELQSLMRNSYAVFCLKKIKQRTHTDTTTNITCKHTN